MAIKNPILRKTIAALLFLLILVVSPLVMSVVLCFWFLKNFLKIYKTIFKPNYGQLLSGLGCLFASDSPYATPLFNASIRVYIKGRLDLKDLRRHIEKVLGKISVSSKPTHISLSTSSSPNYPELVQYLSTWMGYSVWKNEVNFDVSDHVKMLDVEELNARFSWQNLGKSQFKLSIPPLPLTKEGATSLAYDLNHIPFKSGTSPWELLVCHEVDGSEFEEEGVGQEEPVTLLFIRLHHLLGDGISAIAMLSHFVDDPSAFKQSNVIFSKETLEPTSGGRGFNPWMQILDSFIGLYAYICHGLETAEEGPWVNQPLESTWADRHVVTLSVPYGFVKKIMKVHQGVQFSSVLIAVLAAAIRRYMTANGIKVPDEIHSSVSVAQPRDHDKICNKVTLARVKMPVGLNKRDELIRAVNKDYLTCIYSSMHRTALMLCSIYGQFPQRFPIIPGSATCASSNLILFHKPTSFAGKPMISVSGNGNLPPSIAIVMHTAVYVDRVDVNLGMGKHIFKTEKEARELKNYLESEFWAFRVAKSNFICPEPKTVV